MHEAAAPQGREPGAGLRGAGTSPCGRECRRAGALFTGFSRVKRTLKVAGPGRPGAAVRKAAGSGLLYFQGRPLPPPGPGWPPNSRSGLRWRLEARGRAGEHRTELPSTSDVLNTSFYISLSRMQSCGHFGPPRSLRYVVFYSEMHCAPVKIVI